MGLALFSEIPVPRPWHADKVMESIRLTATHVIPALSR